MKATLWKVKGNQGGMKILGYMTEEQAKQKLSSFKFEAARKGDKQQYRLINA